MADYTPPPYAPNVVNQTVDYGGVTWKGQPGGGWVAQGWTGGGGGGGGGSYGGSPAPKPYSEVNPWSFDEALAKAAATQQYAPYYAETLKDYMATVENTKSRSVEDLQKTLDLLSANKEYFTGTEARLLRDSIRNTNEGYAGNGLFFSGARPRDIQELKLANSEKVNDYMAKYNYDVNAYRTKNTRTLADVTTEANQYQRDLEREKQYAIESGVLQRKSEKMAEYNMGMNQYYDKYYNS